MEFVKTPFEGLFVLKFNRRIDHRGTFTKVLHRYNFEAVGLPCRFEESYFSSSVKHVIRGMHFQLPPFDHYKLVYPVSGRVLDVLVDLRNHSETFQQCFSIELSLEKQNGIYIPKGIAHGFLTLSEESTLIYNTSTVYNQDNDTGVRWDSIDFEWPVIDPVVSERDLQFDSIKDFNSPF